MITGIDEVTISKDDHQHAVQLLLELDSHSGHFSTDLFNIKYESTI